MDIPSTTTAGRTRTDPSTGEAIPRIRNLHPSHMSPEHFHTPSEGYGTMQTHGGMPERLSGSSLSERIGSFVGSYSRTSLMFMAENLAVPGTHPSIDDEEDKLSTSSMGGSISRHNSMDPSHHGNNNNYAHGRRSIVSSLSGDHPERTSLFMTSLDKIMTSQSMATVADDYRLANALSGDPYSHHNTILEPEHKSSFAQSIFNSINILLGVGILALPLGFKYAGWALGISVFAFCCLLTNYTAKILGRCLEADAESRTFGDLAGAAYGIQGRVFVTALFVTELITNSVAMVILLSDGLESLFPGYSILTLRVFSFLILTPMLFFPVRYLSYSSLLGIISAFSIIGVMLYDGFTKATTPGSLIEPADTTIWPADWMMLPVSFGLIMAGFASHAVFPTIYRDMENPKRFNAMVNCTYVATTAIYFGVAACGYLMFGSRTMQEITQNIVLVPEYNRALNRLAVWLIALQPIAKYGLNMNPVNLSWQIMVFRHPAIEHWCAQGTWREPLLVGLGKMAMSVFVVCLSILIPGFDNVMSLLGAFFSFMISGIFPLLCHLRLFGDTMSWSEKGIHYVLIFIASCMACSGTLWSFL